jgi:ribonuclease HI
MEITMYVTAENIGTDKQIGIWFTKDSLFSNTKTINHVCESAYELALVTLTDALREVRRFAPVKVHIITDFLNIVDFAEKIFKTGAKTSKYRKQWDDVIVARNDLRQAEVSFEYMKRNKMYSDLGVTEQAIEANPNALAIYTDGACIGNPGRAGYGWLIKHHKKTYEDSAFIGHSTNNIAEMTGVYKALQFALVHSLYEGYEGVTINTDSMYVISGITKWIEGWKKRGWVTADRAKSEIKNKDLWLVLDRLINEYPVKVTFTHVRGHSGDPDNERCDVLAGKAAYGK